MRETEGRKRFRNQGFIPILEEMEFIQTKSTR